MRIWVEIDVFFSAVLSGIFLASCYRAIELVRKMKKHALWVINIEDILYWSMVFVYLFVQIYHTNNGNIRGYYVLGLVVGAVFMWKISTFFAKKWKKFIHKNTKKSVDKSE